MNSSSKPLSLMLALLLIAWLLGLLGVASIYKTAKAESRQPPREPYRWDKPRR